MSRRAHRKQAGWSPASWHPVTRRAWAWRFDADRRLVVRHCGHPTALRPYWVQFGDNSLLNVLGTFSLLAEAQQAAAAWRARR
jgi:hypothetical protein